MKTPKTAIVRRRRARRATVGALLILLAAPTAYADGEFAGPDTPDEATVATPGTPDDAAAAPTETPDDVMVAASTGSLGLAPATGDMDLPVNATIPAPCPTGADSVIVQINGGGFPTGSNALGVTDITVDPSMVTFPMGSWSTIAANNQTAVSALTGTANLKLVCLNGPTAQDYTASVSFAGTPKTYALGGAGNATPSPTPAASPTPTPAGGATPTPTPAGGTPTPTPDSSATPTPEPTNDSGDGTDQGGATADGKTNLPDTGAHARPMLWLAAFLLCSGLALLILAIDPWVEERGWPDA